MFVDISPLSAPRRLALALAVLAAPSLACCGRYGPLEPPGGTASQQTASATPDQALGPQIAKPKIPPIVPPKQPFFLDFLLK